MRDERRYLMTPVVLVAIGVLWIVLLIAVVVCLVVGVRTLMHAKFLPSALALILAGVAYVVWQTTGGVAARFITNQTEGYRPWSWGMTPLSEFGRSAQEFNIPLSYWQVKANFAKRLNE